MRELVLVGILVGVRFVAVFCSAFEFQVIKLLLEYSGDLKVNKFCAACHALIVLLQPRFTALFAN